jgi:hypothetical protein
MARGRTRRMSFIIDAITLPRYPTRLEFHASANVKDYLYPSDLPFLISFGQNADILIIEGWLTGNVLTTLMSTYVTPIDAKVYTEVTIQNSGRPYHNTAFIFVKFDWEERPGITRALWYRMEFWKGSTHTVV